MEVKGWHFVGCSITIEREAIGPAQDDAPHGSTEQLLADQLLIGTVGPDRMVTTDPSDHSGFPTGGGTCGP